MICPVRVRVSQGVPGPPGADGSSTGSDITSQVDSDVVPGNPVYATITGTFVLAQADDIPQARMVGLATTATLTGFAAGVQTQDILTLTTGQWDAVTGDVGGLTPGSTYYLDGATAGLMTKTPPALPVSAYNTRVGVALTTTKLDVKIRAPIKL